MSSEGMSYCGIVKGHALLRKHMTKDGLPRCSCGLKAPKNVWSPVFLRDWHREHKACVKKEAGDD